MINFHLQGGPLYMIPLSIMLLINIFLMVRVVLKKGKDGTVQTDSIELIRQIGLLALAWGVFATVIAFFAAFSDLSKSGDSIPFEVIMGGLSVALITALYGLAIFLFSLSGFLIFRHWAKM